MEFAISEPCYLKTKQLKLKDVRTAPSKRWDTVWFTITLPNADNSTESWFDRFDLSLEVISSFLYMYLYGGFMHVLLCSSLIFLTTNDTDQKLTMTMCALLMHSFCIIYIMCAVVCVWSFHFHLKILKKMEKKTTKRLLVQQFLFAFVLISCSICFPRGNGLIMKKKCKLLIFLAKLVFNANVTWWIRYHLHCLHA